MPDLISARDSRIVAVRSEEGVEIVDGADIVDRGYIDGEIVA